MLKLPWTWYWVKRSCKSKEIDTDEIDFFCRFSDVAFLGSTMLLPPYHDLCRSYFSHLLREDSGRKQAHTHRIWGAWFVTVDSSTTVYIHRFENWWEPEFSGNWSKNLPPDYTWAPTCWSQPQMWETCMWEIVLRLDDLPPGTACQKSGWLWVYGPAPPQEKM